MSGLEFSILKLFFFYKCGWVCGRLPPSFSLGPEWRGAQSIIAIPVGWAPEVGVRGPKLQGRLLSCSLHRLFLTPPSLT